MHHYGLHRNGRIRPHGVQGRDRVWQVLPDAPLWASPERTDTTTWSPRPRSSLASSAGCTIMGFTGTDGYDHMESKAEIESGKFCRMHHYGLHRNGRIRPHGVQGRDRVW